MKFWKKRKSTETDTTRTDIAESESQRTTAEDSLLHDAEELAVREVLKEENAKEPPRKTFGRLSNIFGPDSYTHHPAHET